MKEVLIAGAARTPMGGFQGSLNALSAPELGGVAIRAALKQAQAAQSDEVIMGCVLPAGQGQAPARQAAFNAGLNSDVPATTINKMCGSGMKATMIAFDQIALGHLETVIAGGMESMSNAPYLLPAMRAGSRIGHGTALDHMFVDGLEDAYDKGRLMGTFAEDCAEKYQLTREAQDEYALASLSKALRAQETDAFSAEIASVAVRSRKGETDVSQDEQPGNAKPDKIPHLKPAFRENGTVTAANASSISDGAAALYLVAEDTATQSGMRPLARIVGHASHAHQPAWFTTAPVPAAQKLLEKIGWAKEDVDLWEVNEAFAVVPMVFMNEIGIDPEVVNVNGGACALGHPIGASGARIMTTLLHALEARNLKRGVAAICIGGGEGTAIAIERL
ncbi:MAG: acetyl-CoA C-acyltransferase [Pseudomonadota bacterium]